MVILKYGGYRAGRYLQHVTVSAGINTTVHSFQMSFTHCKGNSVGNWRTT